MTEQRVQEVCQTLHESGMAVSFRQVYAQCGGNTTNVRQWWRQWKRQHVDEGAGEGIFDVLETVLDVAALDARQAALTTAVQHLEAQVSAVQAQCDRAETRLGEITQAIKAGEILLGILRDATLEARRDLAAIAEGR